MATYIRLTDYKSSDEKEQEFFNPENRYEAKQEDFSKIPATPIAYWVSDYVKNIFGKNKSLNSVFTSRKGMVTGNNDDFVRFWQEVDFNKFNLDSYSRDEAILSKSKWFPYNKGGEIRKWYGNFDYIVNWEDDGSLIMNTMHSSGLRPISSNYNLEYIFKKGITWTDITSGQLGFRFLPDNCLFDASGLSAFPSNQDDLMPVLGLMNTKFVNIWAKYLNQTLHFQAGDFIKIPYINKINNTEINNIVSICIDISKEEWDSRETSWHFTKNALIKHKSDTKIETAYSSYCNYWKEQHSTLHQNEEELNRLFIDIYELQDELTPDVELKDITILKNEAKIIDDELVFQADEIMKQFISYGVGVMFGRYSLDSDGLLIANMGQEVPTHNSFEIDDDNVIPVLSDDYFKDDIASRFVQFVKTTFGEEDLSENIRFIENSLGTTLRKYFVKGFYEDHIKRYKKRPIYWMVASPKKGFMSLIYMHRYEADTFARVRNSYLTEYIAKLEAHKETLALTTTSDTASDRDKKDADKQMKNITTKLKEIIDFDRDKMMSWSQNPTEIDLDDGVKVNYCKFKDILYPITGLCK